MKKIDLKIVKSAMSYQEYTQKVKTLLSEGKTSTTGFSNSPDMLHYTEMNLQRMHRLDKTTQVTDDNVACLSKINQPFIWLVITEGWCGDAAQIIPIIEKMAKINPNIRHKLIFRDENPDIMDAFLTDKARSIPMLIVLDSEGNVLKSWGPRPQALQNRVLEEKMKMLAMTKEERAAYFEEMKTAVQKWYNSDKTISIQKEIVGLLISILSENTVAEEMSTKN